MAQVLSREFDCLTCHKPVKIAKIDGVGPNARKQWNRFGLDGVTPHECKKQSKKEEQELWDPLSRSEQPQIAELAKQVSDLKITINILISQIQSLRSEVRGANNK